MNRNPRIVTVLLIAAIILLSPTPSANAAVVASLNVFPDDFAHSDGGGSWVLVARTDDPNGIAALVVDLLDVDNFNGPDTSDTTDDAITLADDIGAINPIDEGGINERPPYLAMGNVTELIYGQDISDEASVVIGVGTALTSDGPDPLGDPAWDIHTIIAWGTYPGQVPQITHADANEFDGMQPPFTVSDDGPTTWVTRVAVPEPSSLTLCTAGLAAMAMRRRQGRLLTSFAGERRRVATGGRAA